MILQNNTNQLNKKNTTLTTKIMYFFVLMAALFTLWLISIRMEGQPPNIETIKTSFIGKHNSFPICVTDRGCGLRRIVVTLFKDDLEIKLAEKKIDSAKLWNNIKKEKIEFQVEFSTDDFALSDGKAILQVLAWDSSIRNFGNGNKSCMEMEFNIDTCSPKIDILSTTKNINQGGSGIVTYRLSEPCMDTGVMVGNNFFPGYPGHFKDESIYLAFFALSYKQNTATKIFISATDQSNNNSRAGFKYRIHEKTFLQDKIVLSDQFLNWRMPEFSSSFNENDTNLIDLFLIVNNEMREMNGKKVHEICATTEQKIMWSGQFLRLPRSVNKAGFADERSYVYNGKTIDQQVHFGIDLASNARSPIPCANAGKVIFSDNLGIYGNTVIIDHGFGLFSLYSHLSQIYVEKNEMLSKGSIVGQTGNTGLAGGDHLHFAMMINNTYVNPIEWWDKAWVENNITKKIHHFNHVVKLD